MKTFFKFLIASLALGFSFARADQFALPYGWTGGNGILGQCLLSNGAPTAPSFQACPGGGGGTVSSVGLTLPSIFTVTGSPVTTSGALAATFATGQTANSFLASPNGSTGAVSLRTIVLADLPPINVASTANGGVTGSLATTNGGTGQNTITLGDLLYGSASNVLSKLAGNTTTTKQFLSQTGNGTVSAAPVWGAIASADLANLAPSFGDIAVTNINVTGTNIPTTGLSKSGGGSLLLNAAGVTGASIGSGTSKTLAVSFGLLAGGTKFTAAGTGCTVGTTTGGNTGGTFALAAGPCTSVVLTLNGATGSTMTNGWTCQAHDRTAPTVLIGGESSSTATTATITIPAGAGATDVISFSCTGY
jgi:hypothetical protein